MGTLPCCRTRILGRDRPVEIVVSPPRTPVEACRVDDLGDEVPGSVVCKHRGDTVGVGDGRRPQGVRVVSEAPQRAVGRIVVSVDLDGQLAEVELEDVDVAVRVLDRHRPGQGIRVEVVVERGQQVRGPREDCRLADLVSLLLHPRRVRSVIRDGHLRHGRRHVADVGRLPDAGQQTRRVAVARVAPVEVEHVDEVTRRRAIHVLHGGPHPVTRRGDLIGPVQVGVAERHLSTGRGGGVGRRRHRREMGARISERRRVAVQVALGRQPASRVEGEHRRPLTGEGPRRTRLGQRCVGPGGRRLERDPVSRAEIDARSAFLGDRHRQVGVLEQAHLVREAPPAAEHSACPCDRLTGSELRVVGA